MIPDCIKEKHVRRAIRRINSEGVPPKRKSRTYCLIVGGKHYPPKYTIALAHEIATGTFLESSEFAGGTESNDFLEDAGFKIHVCSCRGIQNSVPNKTPTTSRVNTRPEVRPTRHNERCSECKVRVHQILSRIYGTCNRDHKFEWSTRLSDYTESSIYPTLRKVATVLEKYRDFSMDDFVRSKTLARCDYWVSNPGFIVEFDESQHFTIPRMLSLAAYSINQPLGFSVNQWIGLCVKHNAKDNDPPFRDEQRAWYDTLRDIVPSSQRFRPTLRLYPSDCVWCSLDPDNIDDQRYFLAIALQGYTQSN